MFNKFTFNKQALIILIHRVIDRFKNWPLNKFNLPINKLKNWPINKTIIIKFIGQIKGIFSRLTKKTPEELIPDGLLGITINNEIIALAHVVVNNSREVIVKSHATLEVKSINGAANTDGPSLIQSIITKYIQEQQLQRVAGTYILADNQYTLSPIELPPGDKGVKEKAILWGVKDYINYSIDDALLESFEISIPRTQDNVKLAYAVAMRAKLSEEVGTLINGSGVRLKYIDINELSIRNITILYEDLQQGCLLLKIGEINSNILLLKNKELLVVRNTKLPLKKLDLFDPSHAEQLDDRFNVAENLILELQRSLDYANSLFRELRFNSINILPCNVNLDLFIPWATEQIDLPINKIDLTQKIKFEQNISFKEQADCLSAIGGALRILET